VPSTVSSVTGRSLGPLPMRGKKRRIPLYASSPIVIRFTDGLR
jgi:hypothetical protein